ncbi:uncharacterized protein PITG_02932 [Phytophthora infestans T30-4]|uniref:Uncharacterized protein n=1 Tax=Phytophthora infestans (strain T30-4) TaxID=403677 RepID=D0MXJ0_PHYIT|nr:uncharacterized protein PITG_02932 [Phytophthora infestans T30-4]EEY64353.1 hypothetical protein PITG_02932 [Phytophthora infestans T30-4]|eukprot:XP_002907789.1 hypothetical protein PITG_02932 [Phytophthora infestans T30-4]
MRTTFTFDDDKPLVHLAQGYIDGGTHIPWSDVAHIMRSTKHTAVAHRQPLQALSSGTSRPVHEGGYCHKKKKLLRPHRSQDRGRHQNLTQGLEQHVKQHAQQRLNYLKEVGQQPLQLYSRPPEAAVARAVRADARNAAALRLEVRHTFVTPGRRPTDAETTLPKLQLPFSNFQGTNMATTVLPMQPAPVLCSLNAEKAVTAIFAGVPRAAVAYTRGISHLNVGEVLPPGVTILLQELVTSRDVTFVLYQCWTLQCCRSSSACDQRIGFEVRADVQNVGVDMIARSPHARRIDERVDRVWKNITGLSFSRVESYAQATLSFGTTFCSRVSPPSS